MYRDGFASLLALVLLAVASTIIAGLLATARSATLHASAAGSRIIVDDLLADGERFACHWLQRHAQDLVLPPAGGLTLLCDQRWADTAGRSMRLAIAVHDAYATLPRSALVAGHPLRMALATPGAGPVLRADPMGIPSADLLAAVDRPSGWTLIPQGIPEGRPIGSTLELAACSTGPILACWFGPDNDGVINANTAPAAVVRTACASSGLDGEAILNLRRDGKRWSGPPNIASGGLQIVPTSNRWNLLIVVERAQLRSARWAVGDGTGGQIRIIRRHDATPRPTPASAP